MSRLEPIATTQTDDEARALITEAEEKGAPDPRIMRILVRSRTGRVWARYWNALLHEGALPHRLKELCRIRMSVAHRCGYCSTVRSSRARAEGLTEELLWQAFDHETADGLSEQEKTALWYADLFKSGEGAIDDDAVFARLRSVFSDEEIIELGLFCAEVEGVGRFARSLQVISWDEACAIDPRLAAGAPETGG
ncbi:carboxymuconolactone decarboxylase family protein [Aquibium sp. A9E412]|uniref:carboxymuconolactone decarboxylase family protein n=1 Tax=Aquibium sp. A9E412 TaxID=2976767 RepID=UPI0025AF0361|nr:carboxymuconolactone decarboxylase family protein [Aquibium sp. A9E412]MDN2567611.1 carboxymuconolactone decarboxylase family protein [Aquibium sp. A9E412]